MIDWWWWWECGGKVHTRLHLLLCFQHFRPHHLVLPIFAIAFSDRRLPSPTVRLQFLARLQLLRRGTFQCPRLGYQRRERQDRGARFRHRGLCVGGGLFARVGRVVFVGRLDGGCERYGEWRGRMLCARWLAGRCRCGSCVLFGG